MLLARAAVARDVLPEGLRAAGLGGGRRRGLPHGRRPRPTRAILDAAAAADAITFTSSSTVTHYLDLAGAERVPPTVVCIGPVTAETARAHGLAVTAEAAEHTIDGLVEALTATLAPA